MFIDVVTCSKSLGNTTDIVDPFLSTLLQMIQVDQIPTNVLIVAGHKISDGTYSTDESTRQVFL